MSEAWKLIGYSILINGNALLILLGIPIWCSLSDQEKELPFFMIFAGTIWTAVKIFKGV